MSKNISHSDSPPFPQSNNETYQRKNKNVSSQFKMNKKPGCFQNKVLNFNLREFIKTFMSQFLKLEIFLSSGDNPLFNIIGVDAPCHILQKVTSKKDLKNRIF